jgi:hypothetical protein
MLRTFVVGNGPSLLDTDMNALIGERAYAVNRIWKLWENNKKIEWRPTDYVRCEYPRYSAKAVDEDLKRMMGVPCIMHLEKRLYNSWRGNINPNVAVHAEWIDACEGTGLEWCLPTICICGTVVNTAIQIAITDGADEIYLLGCDLGEEHFYKDKKFDNSDLALRAHVIAHKCSPVPIYNAGVGGGLEVYPRDSVFNTLSRGIMKMEGI